MGIATTVNVSLAEVEKCAWSFARDPQRRHVAADAEVLVVRHGVLVVPMADLLGRRDDRP